MATNSFEKPPAFLEKTDVKEGTEKTKAREAVAETIYEAEFVDKLDDVLKKRFKVEEEGKEKEIVLQDIVDRYLEIFQTPEFSTLTETKKAEVQKRFVQELVKTIYRIPPDTWSFYFDRVLKTGRLDCSACAALIGLILERTQPFTGIKSIERGMPYGHAVNIVELSDGQIYYVDSRNNIFESLTNRIEIEERGGLKVYKIKEPIEGIDYRIIPVVPLKRGTIISYLSNLCLAFSSVEGEFAESLKITCPPEELKRISEEAKEIIQEKGVTKENIDSLRQTRDFFRKEMFQYENSQEFQAEIRRFSEFYRSKIEREKENL